MAKEELASLKSIKVLVVDDDSRIRWTLGQALVSWGYSSAEAGSVAEALETFENEHPTVTLLDIELPDGSGIDVLNEIRQKQPDAVVIMITGSLDVGHTVAALRGGAHDYISKPIHLEELRVTIRNGIETRELRREVEQIRRERTTEFNFSQIIGESQAIKKTIEMAKKVAASDFSSILLQGESGTGKDLIAKAIHYASERAEFPFVAINCAALPATLIESELFGYEKGAFTDAKARKEGLFEQAEGGTLFLDEIGELELQLQAKLLRVLEEGMFRRVGGLKDLPLNVRVIAASNRDLKKESSENRFRLDLYYRLSVIQLDIPPLRDRGDDVLLLADYYIQQLSEKKRMTHKIKGLSPEVQKIFKSYEFPGNVRELRNIIERALILEDHDLVTTEYLPADLALSTKFQPGAVSTGTFNFVLPEGGVPLEDVELQLVQQAMERTNGNLTHAAKLLNVSRDQIRYRLKKSGADAQAVSAES